MQRVMPSLKIHRASASGCHGRREQADRRSAPGVVRVKAQSNQTITIDERVATLLS